MSEKEIKNVSRHVRVSKSLDNMLEKLCKKEKRKMAAMIRILIEEGLKNRHRLLNKGVENDD